MDQGAEEQVGRAKKLLRRSKLRRTAKPRIRTDVPDNEDDDVDPSFSFNERILNMQCCNVGGLGGSAAPSNCMQDGWMDETFVRPRETSSHWWVEGSFEVGV